MVQFIQPPREEERIAWDKVTILQTNPHMCNHEKTWYKSQTNSNKVADPMVN